MNAELVIRRGTPPDAEYTFKHALVQDAAYSTLLRSRRKQIHARVALTVESQFPEIVTAHPALLARHCAEAGLTEKAVAFRLKAGQQALARSAMMEASAQLHQGLDLLSGLTNGAERQQLELDLQSLLGMTLSATEGYGSPAVADAFARARQLCQELDQPSQLARVLVGHVLYHFVAGAQELACQESKEILDLGEARNDTDIKFQGCLASAVTWFHIGDFSGTRSYAERALTLYDPRHPSLASWPQDPYATALAFSGRSLAYLGFFDQARTRHEEAVERARQRSHPHTIAAVHGIWGHIQARLGCDPAILLRQADENLANASDHGYTFWVAVFLRLRGSSLLALGRVQEALKDISDGLATLQATGSLTTIPSYRTVLAEALGEAGRPTDGLAQLDEAERQIEATQERWTEADLHHYRGKLLVCVGDLSLAEQSFQRAIAVARSQTAKLYEVRAATSLASLWRDQGKRTEARNLLAPIYGWFTEGFNTPVLKEAKVLLDEVRDQSI